MSNSTQHRKFRMGMIGGGIGSFIGSVHRSAAALDGQIELVCGVFNSDPERSKQSGREYYLDDNRIYGSYQEMIEKESNLPDDQKMDFVAIVTPNHQHFEPAKMALEHGFHVVCEKPVTLTSSEAIELQKLSTSKNLEFAITHPYVAYPLVMQAREMIQHGALGDVRKVIMEYSQGWLSTFLEKEGNPQASWRTDPTKAGSAGSIGDIGTHAFNLAEYVSGLQVDCLYTELSTFVEGRQLDDDANMLLRFKGGAKGVLIASQISAGEENRIVVRVYCEKGSLEWAQMEPNTLILRWLDKPMQFVRAGDGNNLGSPALANTRLPMGHPEGLIEAFANIYTNFARKLRNPDDETAILPTIDDGVRTMQFIEAVVKSAKEGKWTNL